MSSVVKLPTAAPSYLTVRKAGRFFDVVLVTPVEGMRALTTALYRLDDRDAAVRHGIEVAERMKRPFKLRGVAA